MEKEWRKKEGRIIIKIMEGSRMVLQMQKERRSLLACLSLIDY